MTNLHKCDCGTSLPYGAPMTQERYAHNVTLEHKIAVLKQTGAPESLIARYESELKGAR